MAQSDQNPQDPNPDVTFGKFSGLKNTVTAERLTNDELQSAVNIEVDDQGQIRRRRGYTKKLSGRFHSLFAAEDGTVYGVMNGNLVIINPGYTTQVLKTGLSSDPTAGETPLSWVQVGDTLYYSSPQDNGKIVNGVALPWGTLDGSGYWLSPVVTPTATLAPIRGKLLRNPPKATCMTYWNGRIYMGAGNVLWATELFLYDVVDATRTFFQFEGEITVVGTVTDGIYVGTDQGLWFLTGPTIGELKRVPVMDSAVIPGSMVDIPAELANPPQVGLNADTEVKISLAFLTTNGFCVAQDGGQAYNLTEDKFIFPDAARASALWRRQDGINQYVAVTDSEGDPATSARIGDYLDATIIRAGGWSVATDGVVIGDSVAATIV
ncbi:hypothetical protein [Silvimonas sp.]|uniref:hypothetical protein n=1 Tax=Silvimonas sp. TaxID=2650811 RepID=UPI00283B5C97|nr:hypothetical protein [Silvimonas sp.]MDR3427804.1 hypothetical protein [Silvimonas sp.]